MRFGSISDIDGRDRSAGSGKGECFVSSAIVPEVNRGVSNSSTAKSSGLVLLLGLAECLQSSVPPDPLWLYVEDVLDLIGGFTGGGIEMLALSEWVSDVPGSAYRPFLLDVELALEAEDRL
jgi:hypothetical protein